MPGRTIGKIMNRGYAGTVSRSPDTIISAWPCKGANIHFGDPVAFNATDSTVSLFDGGGNAAADFIGVAVRSVKQAYDWDGNAFYKEGDSVDVLTRGYISVHTAATTIDPRGAAHVNGTAFDISGGVTLTNAVFANGKVDANGITELTVLTRSV